MTYKLPKGWEDIELGEIITLNYGKSLPERERVPGEIPVYSSAGETGIHNEMLVDGPGIIVGRKGTIGTVYYEEGPFFCIDTAYFIEPKSKYDLKYLYFLLLGLGLEKLNTDTAVPGLNRNHAYSLRLELPPIKEQKEIGDTLSAIDNKIKTNNKINKNLEQQAQAIYKHWFIDFEFPDENEKPYNSNGGEMIESELKMIPKDWKIESLGKSKLGKLMSSGITDFTGKKIYLATADVVNTDIVNNNTFVTMKDKPSRANMQPKPNTLWFAKMKESRKILLVDQLDFILQDKYIFSTGFAGIQANKISVYYLWTYIQSQIFNIKKDLLCTGTTMQAINNKNINEIKISIPKDIVLEKFNTIVNPLFKNIINNREQNQKLSQLRDTLLPQLMSGKIRIPLELEV